MNAPDLMADARIRELESERREFQALIRMCLQQFEFQYGKRRRGWDARFLMDRCEAVLDVKPPDTVIDSASAFADYLPLSPVRIAPGEYAVKSRDGRTLWHMDGAALCDWVCQSVNGYDSADSAMATINTAKTETQQPPFCSEGRNCYENCSGWTCTCPCHCS